MNKKHKSNCPLCGHPDIERIEQLFGDWHMPAELIRIFNLVGPGRTYENESAAFRGIKRHMAASRKPLYRRIRNAEGAFRCYARSGPQAIAKLDQVTLYRMGLETMAKLGEMTASTQHHLDGECRLPPPQSLDDIQLKAMLVAALAELEPD